MNLVGTMAARNEDWIIGLSARVALTWCDSLVIFNHASTDRTSDICSDLVQENLGRVSVIWEPEDKWDEMNHRQRMLDWARANNEHATHIAIIDADEILTANLVPSVRDYVKSLSYGQMMELPGYNLRGGLGKYHNNGIWGQRWFSTAFKDVNTAAWRGDKFHQREPEGLRWLRVKPIRQGQGGTLHLWGASEERLHQKHRLYRVMERVRFPQKPIHEIERMYSWAEKGEPTQPAWGTPATWTFVDVPATWLAPYVDLIHDHLDLTSVPWQKAEANRIIEEHGGDFFAGLAV